MCVFLSRLEIIFKDVIIQCQCISRSSKHFVSILMYIFSYIISKLYIDNMELVN